MVKKFYYGGLHTAFINVPAVVCLHCGEKLYTPVTVRKFEKIEAKLEKQEFEEFQSVGKSFEVVAY